MPFLSVVLLLLEAFIGSLAAELLHRTILCTEKVYQMKKRITEEIRI